VEFKLKPHQERVVQELKELEDKLEKLHNFIISDSFDEIVGDPDECSRLVYQRHTMQQYAIALKDRIKNFK
jgi:predicted nuclease with TOPRIM domain